MNFRLPRSPKCECLLRLRPNAKAAVLLSFLVVARHPNPSSSWYRFNKPTINTGQGSYAIALSIGVRQGWHVLAMYGVVACIEHRDSSAYTQFACRFTNYAKPLVSPFLVYLK